MEKTETFLEQFSFEVESTEVVEDKGKEFLKLGGTFQKANYINQNERVYPFDVLKGQVKKYQAKINHGSALGKAYHPGFFDSGGSAMDISHRVIELKMEGDDVKGKLLILNTNAGKEVRAIIEGGGKLGISSRGYGSSIEGEWPVGKGKKKVRIIQDDYVLEAFDIVTTPSVKPAMLSKTEQLHGIDNKDKEPKIMLTVEEFKVQQPDMYKLVHGAAYAEGQTAQKVESDKTATDVLKTHESAIGNVNTELDAEKAKVADLTTKNEGLGTEVKTLKEQHEAITKEKVSAEVKAVITDSVGKSEFKGLFEQADIDALCTASSVEVAKELFTKHEGLIKRVNALTKGEATTTATGEPAVNKDDKGATITNEAKAAQDAQDAMIRMSGLE